MKKKVISFALSVAEIDKAIKELEQYKDEISQKADLLREKVAERIANIAQSGFNGAIVDDLLTGGAKTAQVSVSVSNADSISLVIANGEDAVWVEFGAGVYYNGSAGSSPHPDGSALGFAIGKYGKGMGKRNVWGYYDEGTLHLTHGTPAVMPMYNAMQTVCNEIAEIAKEVFG